ncbi:hypothetical protein V3331_14295 [Gaopeijia maritima]|uniref:hypothetical protein n=1 Tax=Gaopeijia maritima TaxID=3119007 RepID=UPI00324DAA54
MGRFGTDVLALSCIAGGAVIATGITAALMAGPAHAPKVDAACSSQVVVRVGSAHDEPGKLRVFSTSGACNAVRVDVADVSPRMEEVRIHLDEARARAERARVEAEQVRERAEVVRVQVREVQLQQLRHELAEMTERLDEVHDDEVSTPLVEEALTEAREQLLREIEKLTASVASGGND